MLPYLWKCPPKPIKILKMTPPLLQNGGPTSQVINDQSLNISLVGMNLKPPWSHLGVSCMCLVFQLFASKTAELLAFHQIEVKSSYPKEG